MSMPNDSRTVHTQAELDQAIADHIATIYIDSPSGVWLIISDLGSSSAVLRGSSRAVLRGSSSAVLWGSSRAVLWGSSSAVLWDSSRAELWGSSSAELWGSSSAVLWDSSRAELWDSSSAVLRDSSSAVLRGFSRAELRGSSRAVTAKYTATFLHSQRATFTGDGHLIDLTELDLTDPAHWCEYHGVTVADGVAYLYKAVDKDWKSGYGTDYSPGSTPEAPDWSTRRICGGGLHLSPRPAQAMAYLDCSRDEARFLKCGVRLDEIVTIDDDKVKARRVVVACVEVDWFGDVVERVTA